MKEEKIIQVLEEIRIDGYQELIDALPEMDQDMIDYIYGVLFAESDDDRVLLITKHKKKRMQALRQYEQLIEKYRKLYRTLEITIDEVSDKIEADKLLDFDTK